MGPPSIPDPGDAAPRSRRAPTQIGVGAGLLGIALLVGLGLRLAPILAADFPLRDGGLFVTMAHDIRNAGFGLPEFSTFNTGQVPFAYPPLGIYILALIPGDPITTERWLPLLWSLLAIPAAYLLARELADELRAGLTALIFAAMPVTWAIEGGGVTRALALALLLLALWRLAVLVRLPGPRNAILAGVLASVAVLAHPAVGPSGIASGVVLLAFRPSRRGLAFVGLAGVVLAAVVAPWLAMVVLRYGMGTIVAGATAHHTEETFGRLLAIGPSWIGALDFVLPLALLGLAMVVHRRDWLLPVWLVVLLFVPAGEARRAPPGGGGLAAAGGSARPRGGAGGGGGGGASRRLCPPGFVRGFKGPGPSQGRPPGERRPPAAPAPGRPLPGASPGPPRGGAGLGVWSRPGGPPPGAAGGPGGPGGAEGGGAGGGGGGGRGDRGPPGP